MSDKGFEPGSRARARYWLRAGLQLIMRRPMAWGISFTALYGLNVALQALPLPGVFPWALNCLVGITSLFLALVLAAETSAGEPTRSARVIHALPPAGRLLIGTAAAIFGASLLAHTLLAPTGVGIAAPPDRLWIALGVPGTVLLAASVCAAVAQALFIFPLSLDRSLAQGHLWQRSWALSKKNPMAVLDLLVIPLLIGGAALSLGIWGTPVLIFSTAVFGAGLHVACRELLSDTDGNARKLVGEEGVTLQGQQV